jgi:threonine dehydrogenase-like Zn-dependent dehydrogenase
MRANCWMGKRKVQVQEVPDPKILNSHDAIVKITSTAICGSDLHLYNGFIPTMEHGDILGHEFMGEVVEVGKSVKNVKVGDRVVVPFPISCGSCAMCEAGLFSLCENSNPNAWIAEKILGHSPAGVYGYSHMLGGFAGGQAEYARVPFADVGPLKVPEELTDEQVLFLSDIFPTGYMAAENCQIQPGDTVAIWGCGPVAQFAIQSAWMLGAGRVIAIDRVPERLLLAQTWGRAETIDYEAVDSVLDTLKDMTGGQGPDCCIDAVGMEAHGTTLDAKVDKLKQTAKLTFDRVHVLRESIMACRKGGTLSLAGVYGGFVDKIPMGSAINRGLTFRMAQTPVQRYLPNLLARIEKGEIDPSFVITHRGRLEDGPDLYKTFRDKQDGCIKVVLKP